MKNAARRLRRERNPGEKNTEFSATAIQLRPSRSYYEAKNTVEAVYMRAIKFLFIAMVMLGLSGCASKIGAYDGPEVTRVLVYKGERQMFLMHHDMVLKNYRIGLGFAPEGDKKYEGDGRTPEGHYLIDKRNPNSLYHLSIGISYPNVYDIAEARAMGKDPGGDIFIHGRGPSYLEGLPEDWTWGCIAVNDRQMEDIYAMVPNGTPISIYP